MKQTATRFTATEAGYDISDGSQTVWLSTGDNQHRLVFQRRPAHESDDGNLGHEDHHLYVEYGPPGNGDYNLVQRCDLERHRLHLELDRPLKGATAIDVDIDVRELAFERFLAGLQRVFGGKYHLLRLADELL